MVPTWFWPVLVGVDFTLITVVALAAGRAAGSRRVAAGVALGLLAWLAAVAGAAAAGLFATSPDRPPAMALAVFPPIVAGVIALARSRRLRELVAAAPLPWLVGVHGVRLLGVLFLILLGQGRLPEQFARPAGIGDIVVGALAPLVALALARGLPWARTVAWAWNVLGLVDLALAVGTGVLSAPGPLRVFSAGPSTAVLAQLPMSLIPTFAVPVLALLHVAMLRVIRTTVPRRSPSPA